MPEPVPAKACWVAEVVGEVVVEVVCEVVGDVVVEVVCEVVGEVVVVVVCEVVGVVVVEVVCEVESGTIVTRVRGMPSIIVTVVTTVLGVSRPSRTSRFGRNLFFIISRPPLPRSVICPGAAPIPALWRAELHLSTPACLLRKGLQTCKRNRRKFELPWRS
jgi:hypothetical protein